MIMAPVVVSVIWRWMLHPTNGLVNVGLQNVFGFDPISFFRNTDVAIWTIIFITGWKLIGFSTLIFAAAIANVDRSYLEAAQLDGASRWRVVVRHVILPIISPTVLFMTMLSILLSAQWSFAYINVLTQGGPRHATTNVYYVLWEYGFGTFAVGWSAAAAVILFVSFGLIAWACLAAIRRFSFYDS
jgi:multiple sugar transport system permease protein